MWTAKPDDTMRGLPCSKCGKLSMRPYPDDVCDACWSQNRVGIPIDGAFVQSRRRAKPLGQWIAEREAKEPHYVPNTDEYFATLMGEAHHDDVWEDPEITAERLARQSGKFHPDHPIHIQVPLDGLRYNALGVSPRPRR